MSPARHSPVFKRVMREVEKGNILIPPLQAYLRSPNFKGFDVHVGGFEERKPDGRFHPSTHPTWTERSLYLYLTQPDLLWLPPWDPMTNIALTIGKIFHDVVGYILENELGLLLRREIFLEDKQTGACGSMDGELVGEAYEFKTMSARMMGKVDSAEAFLARYPDYAAQANEYMRMSGYSTIRVLCMVIQYPYEMVEFTIPFDPALAHATKSKYLRVRQAVADQRPPACAGCPGTSCPSRVVCSAAPKIGSLL